MNPKEKDGALHMVGSLADVLLKKKIFKDQVENLIVSYVFPEFSSPNGEFNFCFKKIKLIICFFRPYARSLLLGIALLQRD